MLRPLSLLPAVAVVATLVPAPAVAEPDGERPVVTSRSQARTAPARAHDAAPLQVTIDALSPSYVPVRGPVQVSGSVTNVSEDVWSDVNVYAFAGASPITSSAQLAQERELDAAQPVGDRITAPGTFDDVADLEPGESAQFSFKVPRSDLGVNEAGVYWFGAHALGEGPEGRDVIADGRARTFLPLVPPTRQTLDTALVIPVRHQVRHAEDGSIADVEQWASDLDSGPLRTLVDFGASAGSRPVTWLVDPAVPDAVQSLVAGNPPRSLAATVATEPGVGQGEDDEGGAAAPAPTAEPAPSESAGSSAEQGAAAANAATAPGNAWLDRLREATTGNQILALPYGDVDVSAASRWNPQVHRAARTRSGNQLQPWGLTTSPGIGSPDGFIDPPAIGSLHRQSTVLVTERMFGADAPAVTRTSGRRLVVTSSANEGGPAPGDPLAPVALRQQIVSEAALRLLSPGRKPLVVVLPLDWSPDSTTGFFEGLDVAWLNLTDVDGLAGRPDVRVPGTELTYPARQQRRELDAANFTSATALEAVGETLQNILTRNDQIASDVRDETLTGLSYANRLRPDAARAAADRSRRWIQDQLAEVTVSAPRAVTLSSSTGRFATTLTNGLDEPVTVRLEALADEPLRIEGPENIQIAADSSTSVLLDASSAQLGVSNIELVVTDETGTPLGSTDQLPIRSVQVSQVIWVIVGAGVGLLFGAIIIRLFRRVRRARTG